MNSETKICQRCKSKFVIEAEDFDFYEKVNVPPPTSCPKCRLQRRLSFFNVFSLYQRTCDLCKNAMISVFPVEAPYRVYCQKCWWSDKWNWSDYGREYDFSRPFFEQFNELLHEVPNIGLLNDLITNVNSEYGNCSGHLKNCYLIFHADYVENSAYGFYLNCVNDSLDSSLMISDELCYDSMHSYKCSRCAGLRSQVVNSFDCLFLKDSFNCNNCVASANLRNKQYCIFNKPYSKEDYFKEIGKWDTGSYKAYQDLKKQAEAHWKTLPPKPVFDEFSTNSTGSHVFQSKNCKQCFEVTGAEDSKYLFLLYAPPMKDCYDVSSWGNNLSLSYDSNNIGENSSGLKFCFGSGINLIDAEYCKDSLSGSNHFGCVSVRKGDYVILNKRYEKDEYEKMRAKIIQHMNEMPYVDGKGRIYKYGEFFPVELSPYAYNETIANNFFPLSKEKIVENGYRYRKPEVRKYNITVSAEGLPDHIKNAPDSILNEVIECKKCKKGFKVIPMELEFLRKRNFPLPRECPFCRIEEKFNQWVKNLRLIPRVCNLCGVKFETKYTEEEAPIVYCKKCYQREFI